MFTIMVVDDEQEIRSLYSTALSGEGYQVVAVESCSEATKNLENQQIDLVVLDIQLKQQKSGLDMLKILVEGYPRLPVILCSAHYSYYYTDHTAWLADEYIVKNSNLSELKEKIGNLLNKLN